MKSWWGVTCLLVLRFLIQVQGQGDFDLADALDDPEPTKKPSSDIYPRPKPPYQPQPGGDIYPRPKPPYQPQPGGDIYPRPKPPYQPQPGGDVYPRPKPPPPRPHPGSYDNSGAGGRGYRPNSHHRNANGGDGYSTYGHPQGSTVAKIVSPIVSLVVLTLVGAATRYFTQNRRNSCFRRNEAVDV